MKNEWRGDWWGTQHGGHTAKGCGPTRAEPDPQPGDNLWEQPQDQAEHTDGDHGEVRGTYIMTRWVLVGVTNPGVGLVLCRMFRGAGAPLRGVTRQVQAPKDTVAEE